MIRRSASARFFPRQRVQRIRTQWVQAITARRASRHEFSIARDFLRRSCQESADKGLTTGGKTYQLVTEQARRISACRLSFCTARETGAKTRHNGAFVQDAITFASVIDDDQPTLWQDRVRLDPSFWQSLRDHPVPVREEAIRA